MTAVALSRRAFYGASAVASVALALVVTSVPYLPTNDGPQHVLSGFLQKTFAEPGSPYSTFLEPLPEFAERGFSLVFVPMLELFAWATALKVTLVIIALSGAWAFSALACAVARQRTPWALLGFAFALPWTFYMGFLPFVLAANVGVAIIAFVVAREELRRKELLVLSALLLATAVMHVGAAVTTGAVVLLVFMFRAPSEKRLRALGLAALVGLPAVLVLAAVVLAPAPPKSAEAWLWPPRAEWLVELPRYLVPGSMVRALAGCALVAAGLFTGVRRAKRGDSTRTELALLTAATLFIAGAVLGPLDAPGWQFVAPRLATTGVPLALALLAAPSPSPSPSRPSSLLLAAIAAFTATSLAFTYDLHQRLWRGCEPALAGLTSPVDLAGFTLPMPLDSFCGVPAETTKSDVPHLAPLFHVGALYAVARGGLTPYMFGGAGAVHAFRFREDAPKNGAPPRPPPAMYLSLEGAEARIDVGKREYLVARFAEYGRLYAHVLVVGAREGELARFLARGYDADWQDGSAMIVHPRTCALDVLVSVGGEPGVLVEVGQRPAGPAVYVMPAERGDDAPNGMRRLRWTAMGCGPLWVRGYVDADGSGTASKGDLFCAGAGTDGRLDVDVASSAEVTCLLGQRTREVVP